MAHCVAQEAGSENDENSISLIEFLLKRTPPTKTNAVMVIPVHET